MTRFMSSTFALARPKVPSYRLSAIIQTRQVGGHSYLFLRELTRALVLAVAEQFDDAALIGGKASNLLDEVTDESGPLAEVALGAAHAGLADAGGGLLYSGEEQT
jgi:hypothetical protein